ncbi:MAG: arginine--tRNA ligase [Candidatus Brocadiia bacterium]|jgi:arginyl-tRNA synthetase|nr:arginine--tRNA ligase [Candidatus Brocadiia bacterium]
MGTMNEGNPIREEIVAWLTGRVPLDRAAIGGLIEVPPNAEMGDYALPCFALARELRKAPAAIAEELAASFTPTENVPGAAAAGPYLNFMVNRPVMTAHVLRQVHEAAETYGCSDLGAGETIVIDYSSPNIAKHLAVHHLRSAIIGRSLGLIFRALGRRVVGINHLGDWGTSFGKLIVAFERYDDLDAETATVSDLQDAYVRFSSAAEREPELDDLAREAFRRLETGEAAATELWERFTEISLEEFQHIYDMLGVRFDACTPESFYVPMTHGCIERLVGAGIAQESEGALMVPLDDYDLPPVMLRKSDGATLYITRDICAAEYRQQTYDFQTAIYVVGGEQKLHFAQLRKVLQLMGHEWADRIEHVDFGLVKLRDPETGEARKGATRKGEVVLLEDVLNEGVERARQKIGENLDRMAEGADLDELAAQVGTGAVVFSDLSVKRGKDVIFDWDRMLDFEGDTGPYVQYAHARLCSILRKAGQDVRADVDFSRLELPEEWALVGLLEDWPARIRFAAETREPSVVANYLLELCARFSTYYSAGMREPERRVLCGDEALRAARLLLVEGVRHAIRSGLGLLGMAAPERM